MATANGSTLSGGGIPLEEYRRDVPPGWDPAGMATYPLKVYLLGEPPWRVRCG